MFRYLFIICLLCAGCGTPSAQPDAIRIVTAIPTVDATLTSPSPEVAFSVSEPCSIAGDMLELDEYTPSSMNWVTVDGSRLILNNSPFVVYGVNYYPRMSPFDLFLSSSEIDIISKELDVIVPSGINTLRVFLTLDQLFHCEHQAIPHVETVNRLDNIIQTVASKNLHLIIVLHQEVRNPERHMWEQLQFVVKRYASEPAILAWDVLDKGDNLYDHTSSETILTWLASAILAIRQSDNQHLITAGWDSNSLDTEPLVDFVSFQQFGEYLSLRQEIADLKASTDKPILLTAIGYSTFDLDETAQRNLLFQAFEEVRFNKLAGWIIYMAFDYPSSVTCTEPDCPAKPASINFYGIWNTSYFPKLAVDAVKRTTQTE